MHKSCKFWWSPTYPFLLLLLLTPLRVISKNPIPNSRPWRFILTVFLSVLALPIRSLTHFEWILVYGMRLESNCILLHVDIQLSQNHFLMRLFFPYGRPWHSCRKSIDSRFTGLFLGCQFCSVTPVWYCIEYRGFVVSF